MILALLLASTLVAPDAERAIALANQWKLEEASLAARAAYDEALACDDALLQARALDAIGVVARLQGNTEESLVATLESIAIAESIGDDDALARALNDRGRIHADLLGDPDSARDDYRRALSLVSRDQRIAVRAANNLGNLAVAEHDLIAAQTFYERAAKSAAAIDDADGALAAEHNIGLVLSMSQEPRAALEHFARAMELDRRGGGAQRARILLSRSEAERALGDSAAALGLLRDARDASQSNGDALTAAIVSLREADLRMSRRELTRAGEALDAAATTASRLRDPALASLTLAYRAKLRLAQRRYGEAATLGTRAAAQARELGAVDVVAQAASIAGTAHRARGDRRLAKRAFRDAIAAIEQQRLRVSASPETRQRFFERETYPYVALLELSLEDGEAAQALELAEAAKARVLRDAVRRSSSMSRTPRPQSGELFVEYAVTDAAVIVFTITTSGVTSISIPMPRAELDALTARFARELALRNLAFRATARALYDLLLGHVAMSGVSRVTIVPDGELWRVPFHALIDASERYVIESVEVSYAPSIAFASARAEPGSDRVLLASGLADGEEEIVAIAAIWGTSRTTVLSPASEERVRAAAPHAGIIHLAAHGVYVDADPLQSHLLLGEARFTARELMRLRLPGSLVILSACDMGVGRPAAGEGLVGMTWALLLSGASSVIAAKWEVDSDSTTALMVALHHALATRKTPVESLRVAQMAFLRGPRSHPFYWAGFSVF